MVLRFYDDERRLELGVRDLFQAGRREGDLLEGAPSRSRRLQGIAVHTIERQTRREQDSTYGGEIPLLHREEIFGWQVLITGRMDGFSRDSDGFCVVDEVKSTSLSGTTLEEVLPEDLPEARRQLLLYLHFLERQGVAPLRGRLILVSLYGGARRVLALEPRPQETGPWLQEVLERLILRREEVLSRRQILRASPLPFGYPKFRPGQGPMADAVAETVEKGGILLLEAPTGHGKTAALLWGALRVLAGTPRRLYWLTSRGPQQTGVLEEVARLQKGAFALTAVGLKSKERLCPQPRVLCWPTYCELARDHHGKVWRDPPFPALFREGPLGEADLLTLGLQRMVCPYALAQEGALLADVVVGDFNYAFDPGSTLPSLTGSGPFPEAVLVVDEAHQLADRVAGHLSPTLPESLVVRVRAAVLTGVGGVPPQMAEVLDALQSAIVTSAPEAQGRSQEVPLEATLWQDILQRMDAVMEDRTLHLRLRPATALPGGDPVQELHRLLHRFCQVLALNSPDILTLSERDGTGGSVALRCLDPSSFLRERLGAFAAVVLTSATLSPLPFLRHRLGLEEEQTRTLQIPSSFPPENRRVILRADVSTTWKEREGSSQKIAEIIDESLRIDPRAWLVFCPSVAYRDRVLPHLVAPGRRRHLQTPRMEESARNALLASLEEGGEPGPVLLGVLGGIFAEGVDLDSSRVGGVVVVGPSLPPPSIELERVRERWETRFGAGFDYAYRIPGMQRVIQAAGRVIRSPEDRGTVVLVCKRFAEKGYRRLLPGDWRVEVVR